MLKKILLGTATLLLAVNTLFAAETLHSGKILEFKNSGGYTYIKLQEKKTSFWIAIQEVKVKVGNTITVKEQMWMKNFKSKTLNQTFDKVLFATLQKDASSSASQNGSTHFMPSLASAVKINKSQTISKGPAVEMSIAQINKKAASLKNKNVKVKGTVVKISKGIMKSSWVHIRDKENNKLIFRTPKENLNVGDIVSAQGTLNTDVDYGYGYTYKTIVVNSTFQKI